MVIKPRGAEVSRRAFLSAMASAAALQGGAALSTAAVPRMAALDWAMAESVAFLGHPPLALAELIAFRRTEMAPLPEGISASLPQGITDLGLRGSPNLEVLALSAPDLILSSNYYAFIGPQLSRIAPVLEPALFVPGKPPLPGLRALLPDLAARLGDPQAAERALSRAARAFAASRQRLHSAAARPVWLIEIGDSRHIRVFGDDSLFGGVLSELGLINAWAQETRFAFAAPVPIETLAERPEARIVITGPPPVHVARGLAQSRLWQALPAVKSGQVLQLPEMNGFGGLPSALRFARALTEAVEQRG